MRRTLILAVSATALLMPSIVQAQDAAASAATGAAVGAGAGFIVGGPVGAAVGAGVGGTVGAGAADRPRVRERVIITQPRELICWTRYGETVCEYR